MSWNENPELTEPSETDERPLMGVTGGQRARKGDSYTLTFHDNGEEVETEQGTRAAFDVTLEAASFDPVDGDGNVVEEGTEVRFMTGSARFLNVLKQHMDVAGKTLQVEVRGTGFDAEYGIHETEA